MPTFGKLMRSYRQGCQSPGPLTQERLAGLLEAKSGASYQPASISAWERDQNAIDKDDRHVLVGLIGVFHNCGSLRTLAEANQFLESGNYRALDLEEIELVDPVWLVDNLAKDSRADAEGGAVAQEKADLVARRRSVARVLSRLMNWSAGLWSRPRRAVQLYPTSCGERGIDLADQRLLISSTFGSYFAGLLERSQNYVTIEGQIESPTRPGLEELLPIERVFWALQYPKGPKVLVIAAEGGMGKSTLTAKAVRCLFEEQAVDMLLGDSAKAQQVDAITGKLTAVEAGFYNPMSFYARLCSQLGLPFDQDRSDAKKALTDIGNRLVGRRAIIVVDNLEKVEQEGLLLRSLQELTSRDIRAIVTTRNVSGFREYSSEAMIVQLRPVTNLGAVRKFLSWHVGQHQDEFPGLGRIQGELTTSHLQQLLQRTGGVPLLMQLLSSDVARLSWSYLESLPKVFGSELLLFLYETRWAELQNLGEEGLLARRLLKWVAGKQYQGKKLTLDELAQWADRQDGSNRLQEILRLLYERFLIVNHDLDRGDFAIYPSLAEFLQPLSEQK